MLPVVFLNYLKNRKISHLAVLCTLGAVLSIAANARQIEPQIELNAKTSSTGLLNGDPALDKETNVFNLQTSMIQNAHECFPIYIKDVNQIGILYLYCSDEAQSKDGVSQKITSNFTVPTRIARRYNFWRRIYSLWGGDQYVMHSSHWPEVVLEAVDGSNLPDRMGPIARDHKIKKIAKVRRAQYKRILLSMHKNRRHPERFTATMKRIARSMAHIEQSDKYYVAAVTIRMQKGQRDFIATGLAKAPKYLAHIQKNFAEIGVPKEIALLAFVESSFNLRARSKVGASGVYQIMPATGRQYLKLHSGVDERNDPIKASRAAAKLLKLNYKILGAWPLAITAYNHGVGGLRKAVRKTGSHDISEIIERYNGRAFKFASKNFFTSYLGVLATIKDANRIFPNVIQPAPINFQPIKLRHATSIRTIRKKHDVSLTDIKDYNPDISRWLIRRQGTLPRGFVIKIPQSSSQLDSEADVKPVKLIPNS